MSFTYERWLGLRDWPHSILIQVITYLTEAILSVALLLVITLAVYLLRRKFPYFITGWLWYIGMLVPVIGLLQVGSQAHADRYTYLPQIGLYLAIAWAAVDLSAAWRYQRRLLALAGLAIVTTFSFISWRQVSYWRDSESLWTRSLAVTQDNALAHRNLGGAILQKGMVNDAIAQHQTAVDELGNGGNSIATGNANSESYLAGKSDRAGAIARYVALVNLAHSLFQGGRIDEAIQRYQEAMQLLPDHPQAYNSLGTAYLRKGMLNEAIKYFERGLEAAPDSPVTENNLAWILAARPEVSLRDGSRAVDLARRAEQATAGKDPVVQHTLAAAYAANQQFTEAISVARKASDLATEQGKSELTNEILRELSLYQAHLSYREAR